jgi:hypothetical protein
MIDSCRCLTTVWLSGALALAAADPLWTLWRVEQASTPSQLKAGLDQQTCQVYREHLESIENTYVEIDQDVVQRRQKPVGKRVHFRCRLDGEGPE